MTHTKKILLSLLALAVCGNALQAQNTPPRHEVSATFEGLGLGSMPFRGAQSWNDQPGLSLGFGVGYTYWFNSNFGIRTGLRMNRLSHNQVINNFNRIFSASLPASSLGLPGGSGLTTVNLRNTAASIQEEQQYSFVELPLMLAMRHRQLYLNLGFSLAKAVSASADYSYTDPSCVITELPDLRVTPTTPVPMTLTSETEGNVKNRNMTKPFYFLLGAEAGYNIPVSDATNLSVGLYGRFAPIASKTANTSEAYAIQPDATYQLVQPSNSTLAEKKGYYEVGVSLGVNFGIKDKKTQSDEQPVLTSGTTQADDMASELAAMKSALQEAEKELAATRAARMKAEAELAAIEAIRKGVENDTAAQQEEVKETEQTATVQEPAPETKKSIVAKWTEKILVYFDFDKTQPKYDEETEASLRALSEAMKNDANLRVAVIGHTDNVGTKRKNIKIGRKRAEAVRRLMVDMGAPERNIDIATRGEEEPQDSNQTKDGRANNRRVTVEQL